MKLYEQGYRTGPALCNAPLIEAIAFYLQMLLNLQPRVYSGMRKLYLIQSGGVDLAGESPDETPFGPKEWSLNADRRIDDTLTRTGYVEYMIGNGLKVYIRTLISYIRRKVQIEQNESWEPPVPEWMMTSWATRLSFNVSPTILEKMRIARLSVERDLDGDIGHRDRTTAFQNLALATCHDVDRMSKNGGRGPTYPLNAGEIEAYLKMIETILDRPQRHYRDYLVPTLQTLLDVTRLLYAQLAPIDTDTQSLDRDLRTIRISNETLASIPAPTLPLLREFEEPEVPYITNAGLMYVTRLNEAFSAS